MYLIVIVFLLFLCALGLMIYLNTKFNQKCFSKFVHIHTGVPMPGMSWLESYYNYLYMSRKIGIGTNFLRRNKKYGDVYRMMLDKPAVVVCEPDLVRQVLKKVFSFIHLN